MRLKYCCTSLEHQHGDQKDLSEAKQTFLVTKNPNFRYRMLNLKLLTLNSTSVNISDDLPRKCMSKLC